MLDVVLVLMAGRVALPFLFITSVECVLYVVPCLFFLAAVLVNAPQVFRGKAKQKCRKVQGIITVSRVFFLFSLPNVAELP